MKIHQFLAFGLLLATHSLAGIIIDPQLNNLQPSSSSSNVPETSQSSQSINYNLNHLLKRQQTPGKDQACVPTNVNTERGCLNFCGNVYHYFESQHPELMSFCDADNPSISENEKAVQACFSCSNNYPNEFGTKLWEKTQGCREEAPPVLPECNELCLDRNIAISEERCSQFCHNVGINLPGDPVAPPKKHKRQGGSLYPEEDFFCTAVMNNWADIKLCLFCSERFPKEVGYEHSMRNYINNCPLFEIALPREKVTLCMDDKEPFDFPSIPPYSIPCLPSALQSEPGCSNLCQVLADAIGDYKDYFGVDGALCPEEQAYMPPKAKRGLDDSSSSSSSSDLDKRQYYLPDEVYHGTHPYDYAKNLTLVIRTCLSCSETSPNPGANKLKQLIENCPSSFSEPLPPACPCPEPPTTNECTECVSVTSFYSQFSYYEEAGDTLGICMTLYANYETLYKCSLCDSGSSLPFLKKRQSESSTDMVKRWFSLCPYFADDTCSVSSSSSSATTTVTSSMTEPTLPNIPTGAVPCFPPVLEDPDQCANICNSIANAIEDYTNFYYQHSSIVCPSTGAIFRREVAAAPENIPVVPFRVKRQSGPLPTDEPETPYEYALSLEGQVRQCFACAENAPNSGSEKLGGLLVQCPTDFKTPPVPVCNNECLQPGTEDCSQCNVLYANVDTAINVAQGQGDETSVCMIIYQNYEQLRQCSLCDTPTEPVRNRYKRQNAPPLQADELFNKCSAFNGRVQDILSTCEATSTLTTSTASITSTISTTATQTGPYQFPNIPTGDISCLPKALENSAACLDICNVVANALDDYTTFYQGPVRLCEEYGPNRVKRQVDTPLTPYQYAYSLRDSIKACLTCSKNQPNAGSEKLNDLILLCPDDIKTPEISPCDEQCVEQAPELECSTTCNDLFNYLTQTIDAMSLYNDISAFCMLMYENYSQLRRCSLCEPGTFHDIGVPKKRQSEQRNEIYQWLERCPYISETANEVLVPCPVQSGTFEFPPIPTGPVPCFPPVLEDPDQCANICNSIANAIEDYTNFYYQHSSIVCPSTGAILRREVAAAPENIPVVPFRVKRQSDPFPTEAPITPYEYALSLEGQVRQCFACAENAPNSGSEKLEGLLVQCPTDFKTPPVPVCNNECLQPGTEDCSQCNILYANVDTAINVAQGKGDEASVCIIVYQNYEQLRQCSLCDTPTEPVRNRYKRQNAPPLQADELFNKCSAFNGRVQDILSTCEATSTLTTSTASITSTISTTATQTGSYEFPNIPTGDIPCVPVVLDTVQACQDLCDPIADAIESYTTFMFGASSPVCSPRNKRQLDLLERQRAPQFSPYDYALQLESDIRACFACAENAPNPGAAKLEQLLSDCPNDFKTPTLPQCNTDCLEYIIGDECVECDKLFTDINSVIFIASDNGDLLTICLTIYQHYEQLRRCNTCNTIGINKRQAYGAMVEAYMNMCPAFNGRVEEVLERCTTSTTLTEEPTSTGATSGTETVSSTVSSATSSVPSVPPNPNEDDQCLPNALLSSSACSAYCETVYYEYRDAYCFVPSTNPPVRPVKRQSFPSYDMVWERQDKVNKCLACSEVNGNSFASQIRDEIAPCPGLYKTSLPACSENCIDLPSVMPLCEQICTDVYNNLFNAARHKAKRQGTLEDYYCSTVSLNFLIINQCLLCTEDTAFKDQILSFASQCPSVNSDTWMDACEISSSSESSSIEASTSTDTSQTETVSSSITSASSSGPSVPPNPNEDDQCFPSLLLSSSACSSYCETVYNAYSQVYCFITSDETLWERQNRFNLCLACSEVNNNPYADRLRKEIEPCPELYKSSVPPCSEKCIDVPPVMPRCEQICQQVYDNLPLFARRMAKRQGTMDNYYCSMIAGNFIMINQCLLCTEDAKFKDRINLYERNCLFMNSDSWMDACEISSSSESSSIEASTSTDSSQTETVSSSITSASSSVPSVPPNPNEDDQCLPSLLLSSVACSDYCETIYNWYRGAYCFVPSTNPPVNRIKRQSFPNYDAVWERQDQINKCLACSELNSNSFATQLRDEIAPCPGLYKNSLPACSEKCIDVPSVMPQCEQICDNVYGYLFNVPRHKVKRQGDAEYYSCTVVSSNFLIINQCLLCTEDTAFKDRILSYASQCPSVNSDTWMEACEIPSSSESSSIEASTSTDSSQTETVSSSITSASSSVPSVPPNPNEDDQCLPNVLLSSSACSAYCETVYNGYRDLYCFVPSINPPVRPVRPVKRQSSPSYRPVWERQDQINKCLACSELNSNSFASQIRDEIASCPGLYKNSLPACSEKCIDVPSVMPRCQQICNDVYSYLFNVPRHKVKRQGDAEYYSCTVVSSNFLIINQCLLCNEDATFKDRIFLFASRCPSVNSDTWMEACEISSSSESSSIEASTSTDSSQTETVSSSITSASSSVPSVPPNPNEDDQCLPNALLSSAGCSHYCETVYYEYKDVSCFVPLENPPVRPAKRQSFPSYDMVWRRQEKINVCLTCSEVNSNSFAPLIRDEIAPCSELYKSSLSPCSEKCIDVPSVMPRCAQICNEVYDNFFAVVRHKVKRQGTLDGYYCGVVGFNFLIMNQCLLCTKDNGLKNEIRSYASQCPSVNSDTWMEACEIFSSSESSSIEASTSTDTSETESTTDSITSNASNTDSASGSATESITSVESSSDSASATASDSASDISTATESSSDSASTTASDSSTATESSSDSASTTASDSASDSTTAIESSSDSASTTASDSSTAIESSSDSASDTTSDSPTATDSSSDSASDTASDSTTATESSSDSASATASDSASDSSTATDSSSDSASTTASDSSTATESSSDSASTTASDSASDSTTAIESSSDSASTTASDSSTAIESSSDSASDTTSDSPTATDSSSDSASATASDSSTATDSSSDSASTTASDSSTATELSSDSASATASDSASDSSTATESSSDSASETASDSPTAIESSSDSASETASDSTTAIESSSDSASTTASDSSTAIESSSDSASDTTSDSPTATDSSSDSASTTASDSSTATESSSDSASATASDSTTAIESSSDSASETASDSSTATESSSDSASATASDSASDSTTATESSSDSASETASDSPTATESSSDSASATASDSASDSSTATDSSSDSASTTASDSSTATESSSDSASTTASDSASDSTTAIESSSDSASTTASDSSTATELSSDSASATASDSASDSSTATESSSDSASATASDSADDSSTATESSSDSASATASDSASDSTSATDSYSDSASATASDSASDSTTATDSSSDSASTTASDSSTATESSSDSASTTASDSASDSTTAIESSSDSASATASDSASDSTTAIESSSDSASTTASDSATATESSSDSASDTTSDSPTATDSSSDSASDTASDSVTSHQPSATGSVSYSFTNIVTSTELSASSTTDTAIESVSTLHSASESSSQTVTDSFTSDGHSAPHSVSEIVTESATSNETSTTDSFSEIASESASDGITTDESSATPSVSEIISNTATSDGASATTLVIESTSESVIKSVTSDQSSASDSTTSLVSDSATESALESITSDKPSSTPLATESVSDSTSATSHQTSDINSASDSITPGITTESNTNTGIITITSTRPSGSTETGTITISDPGAGTITVVVPPTTGDPIVTITSTRPSEQFDTAIRVPSLQSPGTNTLVISSSSVLSHTATLTLSSDVTHTGIPTISNSDSETMTTVVPPEGSSLSLHSDSLTTIYLGSSVVSVSFPSASTMTSVIYDSDSSVSFQSSRTMTQPFGNDTHSVNSKNPSPSEPISTPPLEQVNSSNRVVPALTLILSPFFVLFYFCFW